MMKHSKQEIIDKLKTPLVMKSKTISHIVLEGIDGVGKSTQVYKVLKACNFRYIVYDRGELSNFVFAKRYNRPFISLQRNLPFIYVLLTCDKPQLAKRILNRGQKLGETAEEIHQELKKIDLQSEFIEAAKYFENDYHIITIDTTKLSITETTKEIVKRVDEYCATLPEDETETDWNKSYRKAAKKLGYKFEVRNNQPYLNGKMFMSESTWQNGAYETFSDKSCPDNLLFALSYSKSAYCQGTRSKTIDFAYVINSKINRRWEVLDYYEEMLKHNKTCLVSEKVANAYEEDNFIPMKRAFGNDFLKQLNKCKATIYCARDLEYLKLQTCRLYEAIMANQLIFVDKASDKDCEMLKRIFKRNTDIINLLYVTPETFIENYEYIISNKQLHETILKTQSKWYEQLKFEVFKK